MTMIPTRYHSRHNGGDRISERGRGSGYVSGKHILMILCGFQKNRIPFLILHMSKKGCFSTQDVQYFEIIVPGFSIQPLFLLDYISNVSVFVAFFVYFLIGAREGGGASGSLL